MSTVKYLNVRRPYKIHSAKYKCYKEESRKRKLELLKSGRNKQMNTLKCGNKFEEITMT